MVLTDILTPERVRVPLEAADKEEVLRELADLAGRGDSAGGVGARDVGDVLRAVREREAILSTGIGNGVAIPHAKCAAVRELRMAAGRSVEPIDFDALDGRPVRLFFFLIGPEMEVGRHVKALSRISRLLRDAEVRKRLLAAPDADGFYRIVEEAGRA